VSDAALAVGELLELVRARELALAQERIRTARRSLDQTSFEGAQVTVHALNLAIAEAKREKERILAEIDRLGPELALHGRRTLEPVLREYYDVLVARLKREKALLSNPRRRPGA
jgi:hypothetical protein